jgi:hypothetical protein
VVGTRGETKLLLLKFVWFVKLEPGEQSSGEIAKDTRKEGVEGVVTGEDPRTSNDNQREEKQTPAKDREN